MFGSEILEIAIGLVFIYLLLSLVVTAVTEFLCRLRSLRSKNLRKGISNLIGDLEVGGAKKTADDFFGTSMIKTLTDAEGGFRGWLGSLFSKKDKPADEGSKPATTEEANPKETKGKRNSNPSYIPAERFYQGLFQILEVENEIKKIEDLDALLEKVEGPLKENLVTIRQTVGKDLDKFKKGVEDWFDDSMDRVTGWFKRQTHTISLCIALIVTVVFNANTIKVAEVLWNDEARRQAVVQVATEYVKANTAEEKDGAEDSEKEGNEGEAAKTAIAMGREAASIINQTSGLPLGWQGQNPICDWTWGTLVSHLLGWILTAFALSLGAPFWFDILTRLVNLRTAGVSPEESAKKKAKLAAPED